MFSVNQLITELNNDPEDVIEFLEKLTDANIQDLKDQHCETELQKIKEMAKDVLIMLQTTASGGHLVDVGRIQKIIGMI